MKQPNPHKRTHKPARVKRKEPSRQDIRHMLDTMGEAFEPAPPMYRTGRRRLRPLL